jgi:hypothetical protein
VQRCAPEGSCHFDPSSTPSFRCNMGTVSRPYRDGITPLSVCLRPTSLWFETENARCFFRSAKMTRLALIDRYCAAGRSLWRAAARTTPRASRPYR